MNFTKQALLKLKIENKNLNRMNIKNQNVKLYAVELKER